MKPIKEAKYQQALSSIEFTLHYRVKPKCLGHCEDTNIDTLQELINNYEKLERAYSMACYVIAHTNNKMTPAEIKDCEEDWKTFLLDVKEEELYKAIEVRENETCKKLYIKQ